MSGRLSARATRWLFALFALGCNPSQDELGSVMLAISTDMYVDKDVSRVDILVQPESGPLQSTQVNLFPELEGQFLPGTFSIVEGSQPGAFVRVRIIARQENRVRVVREAALRVPRRRTALLSMPIQWLCDGQVRQEGQIARSDCPEGETCISGTCQPDLVEEAALPDYVIEDVFGGGNATGGGDCFDTVPCFADAVETPLDVERCVLGVRPSSDLNVALMLPAGGDGHCTESACWIPLDATAESGWSAADGGATVQLPPSVCERVEAGTARVRTSSGCESKSPDTPTCGPWTLVGTAPGSELDPTDESPAVVTNRLVAQVASVSQRLAAKVAQACAAVTQSSAPAEPSSADIGRLCDLAGASLGSLSPLTWYRTPTRCWPDHTAQLACERSCDPTCDPGTLEQRCPARSLVGRCAEACDSRQCVAASAVQIACAGACQGTCRGTCAGRCVGTCTGTCDTLTPDGFCDGACDGSCIGLCDGRCKGSCEGLCDGDPNVPVAACDSGASCIGGCAGEYEAATCGNPLLETACTLAERCEASCRAGGHLAVACEPATAWVLPRAGLTPPQAERLAAALPALLAVREVEGAVVLEEATQLLARLPTEPGVTADDLTKVEAARQLLTALIASASSMLDALGPERNGPGPMDATAAGDCSPLSASGAAPLIDDFEDGDARALANDGRSGSWHVTHDGTGGQLSMTDPPAAEPGGANQSARAMHLSGSGFTEWGAGLTLDLRQDTSPYDASVHQGIKLYARGTNRLRLTFMQQNLAPGHRCSTCDPQYFECGLFYGTEIVLSDTWTEYFIAWTTLGHEYQGGTPFAPEQLLMVQFEAPAPAAFDFWLDDVAFY